MTTQESNPETVARTQPASNRMTVLVVDDAALDRRLAGRTIEKNSDLRVIYANDGAEALAAIEREAPAAVVTDMQMPVMDGLQLVEEGDGLVAHDRAALKCLRASSARRKKDEGRGRRRNDRHGPLAVGGEWPRRSLSQARGR